MDGTLATDGEREPDERHFVTNNDRQGEPLGDGDLLVAGAVAQAAEGIRATTVTMVTGAGDHHLDAGDIRLWRLDDVAGLQADTGESQGHDQQRQDGAAGCAGDHANKVDDHGDVLTETRSGVNPYTHFASPVVKRM